MNSVGSNYQLSFKSLLPTAEYNGIARLKMRPVLREIDRLKVYLKDAEKEIMDTENDISNPDNRGRIVIYLKKRLEILNDYRQKLANRIERTKNYGIYDHRENYKMVEKHFDELEKLEEEFEIARKHPGPPFMMSG